MTIAQAAALSVLGWFFTTASFRELAGHWIFKPLGWSILLAVGVVMMYAGVILILIGVAK